MTKARTGTGREYEVEQLALDYRKTFGCPSGQQVLLDLIPKLYADETTWHADAREHARQEGLRQAWLHINKFLGYSPAQVARLYRGLPLLFHDEVE